MDVDTFPGHAVEGGHLNSKCIKNQGSFSLSAYTITLYSLKVALRLLEPVYLIFTVCYLYEVGRGGELLL